ncbi:VWA domain-containing protein [Rubritalea tangerina]|uniref:VWA domain-containing protein n=2 Tax=Rubritalea tangerina TaxID=430798 RepID=A0ABW4ZAY9_9BACT
MKPIYKKFALASAASFAALLHTSCDNSSSKKEAYSEATFELRSDASDSPQGSRKVWPPATDTVAPNLMTENYLVVLDDSGSMSGRRIAQAKEALKKIARTLPAEHNLGLLFLNRDSELKLGTENRDAFTQLISTTHASGGTPLLASTKRAVLAMTKQASQQKGLGAYHLIIVTDGESSDGSPLGLVASAVLQTAIQVHVVGFHVDDHELNDTRFVDYQTASNTDELIKAFEAVAAETNTFSDPKEFSAH